jgi:CheY-like chemotaxis protein
LLDDLHELLRRSIGEHIEIEHVHADDTWPALVDRSQLESSVLNVCLNARDAMPDGGRLVIETANAVLDDGYAETQRELEPGEYVVIAISDSGTGMTDEVRERAFDPFFTTKGPGRGSGLGLSMVYGFAKQSRGHVRMYSEVGEGTTVKLYVPRAHRGVPEPSTRRVAAGLAGGHETILLVEDDDLVRTYAATQLRALGYRVIEVASGRSALDVLAVGDATVDLLFTDVVMPGMNGRQLADLVHARDPHLPVLFTSGYAESAIVHHGRLDRGVELLTKPYGLDDLAARVRRVLDRAGNGNGDGDGDGDVSGR